MKNKKPILVHPSYYDIEKGCAKICHDILKDGFEPQVVVGLTRGGLLPAVIMSHILGTPMNAVSYSSKHGAGDNKNHVNILPSIPFDSDDKPRLLIVDDIMDSGLTMREVRDHYEGRGYKLKTACLYHKIGAITGVNYHWHQIPNNAPFIIFPWEL